MFEEIEKTKQHSALFTVVGVFVLLATIVGVAVAAYTWNFTSANKNQISTGNISMSYLESVDSISITNALPVTDQVGMASNDYFDFAVSTSASGNPGTINYQLKLVKVAATSGYTALTDNQVKVGLTTMVDGSEVVVMSPKLASTIFANNGILTFDSGKTSYLSHSHTTAGQTKTTKYRLRMWVDYSVDASSWTTATKLEYKAKVNVSGSLTA